METRDGRRLGDGTAWEGGEGRDPVSRMNLVTKLTGPYSLISPSNVFSR